MKISLSMFVFIIFIISWGNKQFKHLEETSKNGIDYIDLLKYIRSIEIRILMMFIGVLIMFMGLQ